jgi:hypothetical protein
MFIFPPVFLVWCSPVVKRLKRSKDCRRGLFDVNLSCLIQIYMAHLPPFPLSEFMPTPRKATTLGSLTSRAGFHPSLAQLAVLKDSTENWANSESPRSFFRRSRSCSSNFLEPHLT